MTAEELIRRILANHAYLMREHIRTVTDRYAMDPQDRAVAYTIVDMVRVGLDFTTQEAIRYIKIVTATI